MLRLVLPLLLGALGPFPTAMAIFYFDWPDNTAQCETYTLEWWVPAHPPFTAFVVPINSNPYVYHIPDDAFDGIYGHYDIELQLNAGTNYVVFMSDASGFGNGGSSEIQFVQQATTTACLSTAATNATGREFTFQVSGVARQCERGFELAWQDNGNTGPYNFTVIPLDQKFFPYDVPIEKGVKSLSDWKLNMTEQSRFTIMMNNANGYGTGGVGGIYSVSNGTNSDCVAQTLQATGSWPVGLATNTLPVGTLRVTDPADRKALSGGAIAGLVIGVLAALAIILATIFYFLRRRRRRKNREAQKIEPHEVDLADAPLAMVEPYQSSTPMATTVGEPPQEAPVRLSMGSTGDATTARSTAGFAGVGAGTAPRGSIEEEEERPDEPGVAGPVARKTLPSPVHSGSVETSIRRDLHVVNYDEGQYPPRSAASATASPAGEGHEGYESRRRRDPLPPGTTTYRRHEDAGRVVDLPPLYTDIPRDSDMSTGSGPTPDYEPPSPHVVHQ